MKVLPRIHRVELADHIAKYDTLFEIVTTRHRKARSFGHLGSDKHHLEGKISRGRPAKHWLDEEWTGLSLNEIWCEQDDRVLWRKCVSRVVLIIY